MCEKKRLRSDCAIAQSDQSLLFSHIQSTNPGESKNESKDGDVRT